MSAKGFRISTGVLAVILGGVLGWSIIAGSAIWVPALAILLAILVKIFMRRKTIDTLTDERQTMLGNKAGVITYRILTVATALAGFVFIWFQDSLPDDFAIIGVTLAFTACAMMIVYMASYAFLNSRS